MLTLYSGCRINCSPALSWLLALWLFLALSAVANGNDPLPLFGPVDIAASVLDSLVTPADVSTSTTGDAAPAIAVTTVSSNTLRKFDPETLQLQLPGLPQPLVALKRHDVEASFAGAHAAIEQPTHAVASATAEAPASLKPYAWVGELEGYPGALSTVALVVSELDGSTYGSIRYVDMEAKAVHSYAIKPMMVSDGSGGVRKDPQRHIIYPVKEPQLSGSTAWSEGGDSHHNSADDAVATTTADVADVESAVQSRQGGDPDAAAGAGGGGGDADAAPAPPAAANGGADAGAAGPPPAAAAAAGGDAAAAVPAAAKLGGEGVTGGGSLSSAVTAEFLASFQAASGVAEKKEEETAADELTRGKAEEVAVAVGSSSSSSSGGKRRSSRRRGLMFARQSDVEDLSRSRELASDDGFDAQWNGGGTSSGGSGGSSSGSTGGSSGGSSSGSTGGSSGDSGGNSSGSTGGSTGGSSGGSGGNSSGDSGGSSSSSTGGSTGGSSGGSGGNSSGSGSGGSGGTKPNPSRRHLQQTGSTITQQDLLIVYTAAAASNIGGDEAMVNAARLAVAKANKAYADSNITMQLVLLDVRKVTYNENYGNPAAALSDLQNNRIPNVHTWREQLGADLVSLFNNVPLASCGLGGQCASGSSKIIDGCNSWSTVMNGCWDGYALARVIGANHGCGNNYEDGVTAGMWGSYAFGWRSCVVRFPGDFGFKTLMSNDCPNGASALLIPRFADPNIRVSIPGKDPEFIGNATSGFCARAIRETSGRVAAWRTRRITPMEVVNVTGPYGRVFSDPGTYFNHYNSTTLANKGARRLTNITIWEDLGSTRQVITSLQFTYGTTAASAWHGGPTRGRPKTLTLRDGECVTELVLWYDVSISWIFMMTSWGFSEIWGWRDELPGSGTAVEVKPVYDRSCLVAVAGWADLGYVTRMEFYWGAEAPPPPKMVARNDIARTPRNQSVTIDVLANDSPARPGYALVLGLGYEVPTMWGTVSNMGNKALYRPYGYQVGNDSFTYTVYDSTGGQMPQQANVTVILEPLGQPPVVASDTVQMTLGSRSVVINPLSNDRDPEGETLLIHTATTPSSGSVQVSYDKRSITYTRANGFTGTATFNYTVFDSGPHYRSGTVTVVVPNAVPVAAPDSARTQRMVAVTIWPVSNDVDPDGQLLQLMTSLVTAPTRGTASVNSVVNSIRYTPSASFTSGTDSLRYRVTDGAGGVADATVTITVYDWCANNQCTPTAGYTGNCSVATGCSCFAGSGLQPTFLSAASTNSTPIAACRFVAITPENAALGQGYVQAPAPGARIALKFTLGSPARCFSAKAVRSTNGVTVSSTACPSSRTPVRLAAVASSTPLGESCSSSVYQVIWQAPTGAGCYNLAVNLVDNTSIRAVLRV